MLRSGIEEINLLAIPVALNFDQTPGPDGFVLKIFAGNRTKPQPIPIESGTIEILMFDGLLGTNTQAPTQPRKVWKFTAEELKPFETDTSIGRGYQVALQWGDARPLQNKITVVARYSPLKSKPILSAPSVIAVTAK